ncbi:MAG: methylenetetrahydrofolate reductase, partial [Acidimicrobiia bacterium]
TTLCAAKIPPRLQALLALVKNDDEGAMELGIAYASEQCQDLLRFGVPGIHFYSLNKSHSIKAIFKNLGL